MHIRTCACHLQLQRHHPQASLCSTHARAARLVSSPPNSVATPASLFLSLLSMNRHSLIAFTLLPMQELSPDSDGDEASSECESDWEDGPYVPHPYPHVLDVEE
jgi:hypothetical protein